MSKIICFTDIGISIVCFSTYKNYKLNSRLKCVTKGRHLAKGYKYSLHVSGKLY